MNIHYRNPNITLHSILTKNAPGDTDYPVVSMDTKGRIHYHTLKGVASRHKDYDLIHPIVVYANVHKGGDFVLFLSKAVAEKNCDNDAITIELKGEYPLQ